MKEQTDIGLAQKGEKAMEKLTSADVEKLRAVFPKDKLGVKVQSLTKARDRAMLVLYLQHTDVMDRLEEVDPSWSTEVIEERGGGDYVSVRMRMTLKGVSRENVGDGNDPKGAYSDALKRCAMLFGVGRYLYDSPTVWTPYNEDKDKFRVWTVDDYERVAKGRTEALKQAPVASSASPARAPHAPSPIKPKPISQGMTQQVPQMSHSQTSFGGEFGEM